MDAMFFQPGDPEMFAGLREAGGAPVQIDPQWRDLIPDPATCIPLRAIRQALSHAVTTDAGNSARTSGRPAIKDIGCSKPIDPMSVRFYEYLLRAKPLGQGKDQPTRLYVVRDSGGGNSSVLVISLRDALLSDVQFQTGVDGDNTETFSLNFTEVLWTYVTRQGRFSHGWSLARNRPIGQFTD